MELDKETFFGSFTDYEIKELSRISREALIKLREKLILAAPINRQYDELYGLYGK